MERIFGFDIGTTSVGFAVIDHDAKSRKGKIVRLGVRIFPESRDPKGGVPLNQKRRQMRMMRRQNRRKKERRRLLNTMLSDAGFLPAFGTKEWDEVMSMDPYELRCRGLTEKLEPFEVGRALYHIAQRRHYKARDLDGQSEQDIDVDADEKQARSAREVTSSELDKRGITLGQYLAEKDADAKRGKPPTERRRGVHAFRRQVEEEFDKLWDVQAKHHRAMARGDLCARVRDAVFSQKPVFWRLNTLGQCDLMPDEDLCPRCAWISHEVRMLEMLNNLELAGGNQRPLTKEERDAVLSELRTKKTMTWAGVRKALDRHYKAVGDEPIAKSFRFNLEAGGGKLLGNAVECDLAKWFGSGWKEHPHQQAIRDEIHTRVWDANYGRIGNQRVEILSEQDRREKSQALAQQLVVDYNISHEQAQSLAERPPVPGWDAHSTAALEKLLPMLEEGVKLGSLLRGNEYHDWRSKEFPEHVKPTGEVLAKIPSPRDKDEQMRLNEIRNPTVVRAHNELRKVINNLIAEYGKPDRIRIELAREVTLPKAKRDEMLVGIKDNEKWREKGKEDLEEKGIMNPSRRDVDKWILWQECKFTCPYTGKTISFNDLFGEVKYDVEHIWPRSRTLDDSMSNKTLCHRDVNIEKGDRTPYECFGDDQERWEAMRHRIAGMERSSKQAGNPHGMSRGKIRKFLAEEIPDDFANRQLNDTSYAAKLVSVSLKRLWPDVGSTGKVYVQAVSGRITAKVRHLWGLNGIVGEGQEKTRDDHRHHAIDALVVACVDPGTIKMLSDYYKAEDDFGGAKQPEIALPWAKVRQEAEFAVEGVVVSHRVQRRVSGPLHDETLYGLVSGNVDGEDRTHCVIVAKASVDSIATQKRLLDATHSSFFEGKTDQQGSSPSVIRDVMVRDSIRDWKDETQKSKTEGTHREATEPRLGSDGPVIRSARVLHKRMGEKIQRVGSAGYALTKGNHHLCVFRSTAGKYICKAVSLMEASRRLANKEPVISREGGPGDSFVMSLSAGECLQFSGTDEYDGIWVITSVQADGRVQARPHYDASQDRPKAIRLSRVGHWAKKISVDPIGVVRPAGD